MAGGKRTAADLGAWLVFEDESGQGLRPPKGRTWGRRGHTPVVTVTGGSNKRVSLAALIAVKPGCAPRLVYRVHATRKRRNDPRKGFTEIEYARLLDAAHQQLGGPIVAVWDNLNTHVSAAMAELIAARDWLTICRLPAYAHELNPVEQVWSHLKRSVANLAKRDLAQLTALVKTRLRRMQYRPALLGGFLASTRLDLTPFLTPTIKKRYSLGCLLYELLTGDVPFHGTADLPLRSHHLNSSAPSVRARRAGIPAAVDELVSSMLAKEPQARPSAETVYEALLPLTATAAGPADDGEIPDPTRPFRWPLLAPPRRREQAGNHDPLTEAGAELLIGNVRALLDHERLSEAIGLLEDGTERAGSGSVMELRLRHMLGATLFYAGEYTRAAALLDGAGRDFRKYLPPDDSFVLDCSYYAGHSYAEIGKPDKALPHLRFYVHNADASAGSDEKDKVLGSRFVIAQMLATGGHTDEALAELEAIRPLLADAFGADSTQIRNLDKQINRMKSA